MKKYRSFLIPILYAAVIAIFSSNSVPRFVAEHDKVFHFFSYLPLGFLFARACLKSFRINLVFIFILGFSFATFYGVVDEWHQSFVPGRFYSTEDMMVDGYGSALGAFLFCLIIYFSRRYCEGFTEKNFNDSLL